MKTFGILVMGDEDLLNFEEKVRSTFQITPVLGCNLYLFVMLIDISIFRMGY